MYWLEAWIDERGRQPEEVRELLKQFAQANNLTLSFELHESLWPAPEGRKENPPAPLANNEITDGPLG